MSDNPDDGLAVRFYHKPVENKRASKEAGRPIYEDREYVSIRFPADPKRELDCPAQEMHFVAHRREQMTYAERFAPIYDAWKRNEAEFVSGTPLFELPALSAARRAELNALNVRTVEQLAGLPDASMRKLGIDGRSLMEAAQAYLDAAKKTADVVALRAEIAALKAQMAGGEAEAPTPMLEDEFEGMGDDDLKNMIRDAGGEVPRGRASRDTLVKVLRDLAAEKAKEAA